MEEEIIELLKKNVDYVEICGHETDIVSLPRKDFDETIEMLKR